MKSFYCKLLLLLPLVLGACAHVPRPTEDAQTISIKPTDNTAEQPGGTDLDNVQEQSKLNLPNVALNGDMLYEFLLGDIALQRGRPEMAAQAYLDLAKTTRDPRVARRAAQLAFESRQMDKSLEAFGLWQELEPSAPLANQMLLSLFLSSGKYQEARPQVAQMLAAAPKSPGNVFMLIHSLLTRAQDKNAALAWIVDVAKPYPNVAEAHWAVAQLASAANKKTLALSEIELAVKLRPEWDMAVMFEAGTGATAKIY
jgi:tetratricopeptide (TPR) repeat protein